MLRTVVLLLAVIIAAPAGAHSQSTSYLRLNVTEQGLDGEWALPLRKLDGINAQGEGTSAGRRNRQPAGLQALAGDILPSLEIRSDGTPCPLTPRQHRIADGYAVVSFGAECLPSDGQLAVRNNLFFDSEPSHRGMVRIEADGATHVGVFTADRREQTFRIGEPSAWTQFREYLIEGVWHIWIGYDHILFLLTLLLPAVLIRQGNRWHPADSLARTLKGVSAVVTSFTLAHSLTLSAAVLGVLSVPARLVEAVIAASIIVAALNNLYPILTRRVWLVTFVFGLVHGLGFANVLQALGLPGTALVLPLAGFNLGVEVGQLVIVAVTVPVLYLVSRTPFYIARVFPAVTGLAIGLSSLWLVERVLDVALLNPALSMFTPQKWLVALGVIAASILFVAVCGRALRAASPKALLSNRTGWSAALVVAVGVAGLNAVAAYVPLTKADRRAAVLEQLVPGAGQASERYTRLDAAVRRLQSAEADEAIAQLSAGEASNARERLRDRMGAARQRDARGQAAEIAVELAALTRLDSSDEAIGVLEDAVEYDPEAGPVWRMLADRREAAEDPAGAAEALSIAIAVDEQLTTAALAAANERLGRLHQASGEPSRAVHAYREAVRLNEGVAEESTVATLYRKIGDVLIESRRLNEARNAYLQALISFEAVGEVGQAADVRAALGRYYRLNGDLTQARAFHSDALETLERLGKHNASAQQHVRLARIAQMQGDWANAADHYRKALATKGTQRGLAETAGLHDALGRSYRRDGDWGQALTAHEDAIRLYERADDDVGLASAYVNKGLVHQAQSEYENAKALFERALKINRRLEREYEIAAIQANLGNIYRLQGEPSLARSNYSESQSRFERLGAAQESQRVAAWARELHRAQ